MASKSIAEAIGLGLALVVLFGAAIAGTQLLWNWLCPLIFGLPEITFWQTAGLMLLSRLLIDCSSSSSSKS